MVVSHTQKIRDINRSPQGEVFFLGGLGRLKPSEYQTFKSVAWPLSLSEAGLQTLTAGLLALAALVVYLIVGSNSDMRRPFCLAPLVH